MQRFRKRRLATAVAVGAPVALVALANPAWAVSLTGPSTSLAPYMNPANGSNIDITSMLTVADPVKTATNGYKMVGIPDGLGAQAVAGPGGAPRVQVYMNHELGNTSGIARANGQKGAFVSTYRVNPTTLEVETGADLIGPNGIQYYDYSTGTYSTSAAGNQPVGAANTPTAQTLSFSRFCSADLAPGSFFYNSATGKGINTPIYFAGEESSTGTRVLGFDVNASPAVAKQLPRLGLMAWENAVTMDSGTDKTAVMGMDDTTDGYLWAYEGTKTTTGDTFDKAGLTNGDLYSLVVAAPSGSGTVPDELTAGTGFRAAYGKGVPANATFVLNNWNQSRTNQNTEAAADGAMKFKRTEDGAWDPKNPSDYYFVTTGAQSDSGSPATVEDGLWKLSLKNRSLGLAGGATLTLLLDGTEVPQGETLPMRMVDNITVDGAGHVLLQEDPGNSTHLSRVLAYDIASKKLANLATFTGGPYNGGTTNDEESSGIIDTAATFGTNTFLLDAQVHTASGLPAGTGAGTVEEFVEQGDLMLLKVKDWYAVFNPLTPVIPEAPVVAVMTLGGLLVLAGGIHLMRRRQVTA